MHNPPPGLSPPTPPAPARWRRPARPEDIGFWRRATAPWRRWPDFLILGTQRGGTTTLYEYLRRHPGIAPASEKEVHYFSFQPERGPGWYRAHFPLRGRSRGQLTGEASPVYLFHPLAPGRVHQLTPNVRLLALLRDPVERAHSHYRLQRRAGIEPLPTFEEALRAEPARLHGEAERVRADPTYYSYAWHHFSYLARGVYRPQLEAWRERFDDPGQLLVLRSEELHAAPDAFYGRVRAFLGLAEPASGSAVTGAAGPAIHLNHQPGEPMAAETRAWLREYFAPHNAALYALLGEDFDWQ